MSHRPTVSGTRHAASAGHYLAAAAAFSVLEAPRGLFRIMRIGSDGRQADDVERVLYGQSRHVNDFEASRMIPEHSKRAGDISAGQHELIAAQ